jgi:hypothetical protein
VPPERLLKASLLTAFYTVRSARLACEQWATTCFSVSTTASSEQFSVDGTLIDAQRLLQFTPELDVDRVR